MTLELIDESDIKGSKVDKKDKKSELKLVDGSDVKEGYVREGSKGPKIELVDKSDVREYSKDPRIVEKEKKSRFEFLAKEKVFACERTKAGMTNNCSLCKALSRDRFDKCPNKYGGP